MHDFLSDSDDPKILIQEWNKGTLKRTIGFNQIATDIVSNYLAQACVSSSKIFRKQLGSKSEKLGDRGLSENAMYQFVMKYIEQLPNAMVKVDSIDDEGHKVTSSVCL